MGQERRAKSGEEKFQSRPGGSETVKAKRTSREKGTTSIALYTIMSIKIV
jgi:hypothetical protein